MTENRNQDVVSRSGAGMKSSISLPTHAYPLPMKLAAGLYERLIHALVENEDWFGLVWQDGLTFSRRAKGLRMALEKLRLEQWRTDRWPGTQKDNCEATVIRYEASRRALPTLLSVDDMHAWVSPERPEDLFFGSGVAELALVSVTHEREAWLLKRRYARLIGQEVTLNREALDRRSRMLMQGLGLP